VWFFKVSRLERICFLSKKKKRISINLLTVFKEGFLGHMKRKDMGAVSGVPRVGVGGSNPPPSEIPRDIQNCPKVNPIVKTVKNF